MFPPTRCRNRFSMLNKPEAFAPRLCFWRFLLLIGCRSFSFVSERTQTGKTEFSPCQREVGASQLASILKAVEGSWSLTERLVAEGRCDQGCLRFRRFGCCSA